jgi:signal transduction histidine kinase
MQVRPMRRLPPVALDAAITVVVLVVGQLELVPGLSPDGYQAGPRWGNAVVMAGTALPLLLRRTAPRTSFLLLHAALVLPGLVMDHSVFFFAAQLPSMLSTYTVARYGRGWLARWSWLSAAALTAAVFLGAPPDVVRQERSSPVLFLVCAGVAWAAGRILRRLTEQGSELEDALGRLAAEQAARQGVAVTAERARIAVEMHDVVAHAVSLMVLQVGTARGELEGEGADVPRLRSAEETGRQAMAELHRVLGVLQQRPDELPDAVPGLAAAAELAEHFRAAGLDLRLDLPDVGGLPASVQLAAYRILQEALTNALKHGGREWVSAVVLDTGHELVITVRNPVAPPGRAPLVPSGRNGLIGMRERVTMFGGSLSSGLRAGGFEVRAVLPLAVGHDAEEVLPC